VRLRQMLTAVDAVEITILVDNLSDSLLPSTPIALRPRMSMDADAVHLRAEHGYGVLVTVESGGRQSSLLYDAGFSRDTPASTTWSSWACESRICEASPFPMATASATAASRSWSRC